MSNKKISHFPSWGSDFIESAQSLESQWFIDTVGDHHQVASSSQILFEMLEEQDAGIRCPTEIEIVMAIEAMSKNGIPTIREDGVLDQWNGWTGGIVSAASLIGALRIVTLCKSHGNETISTVLITSTGMVRVSIITDYVHPHSTFRRKEIAAAIICAFGGEYYKDRNHFKRNDDTTAFIPWRDITLDVSRITPTLYMRFPLWGNRRFPKGVYISSGGLQPKEIRYT